jgi:hypothetical protein
MLDVPRRATSIGRHGRRIGDCASRRNAAWGTSVFADDRMRQETVTGRTSRPLPRARPAFAILCSAGRPHWSAWCRCQRSELPRTPTDSVIRFVAGCPGSPGASALDSGPSCSIAIARSRCTNFIDAIRRNLASLAETKSLTLGAERDRPIATSVRRCTGWPSRKPLS